MAATTPTVSELISDYVAGLRFADLPARVVDRAKELLLFNLGAALRGRSLRAGRQAVQVALDLSSGGRCSIVGEQHKVALLEAVFANSTLMDVVGIKDLLEPSGAIPGSTVHPAGLAVGEWAEASGQQLLTAIVAGYDVMAKLHNGESDYELPVPRPTKVAVEPFGVAAVAAHLLELSREQTADAMGHAGESVMSTYEGQDLMHPLASRNGVFAAMVARAGVPGPRTIVEGAYGIYRSFFLQEIPDSVRANLATLGTDF
jgi:2-methylcitrate dehydratase PrpD